MSIVAAPVGPHAAAPIGVPITFSRAELEARVRALIAEPWARRRSWLLAVADGGLALGAALLWATGYPPGRAATVVAVAVSWGALHVFELRGRRGQDEQPRLATAVEWVMLASGLLGVAVTGGLRSPLVAAVVAALPLGVFQFGWSARTKLQWGVAALGLAAIALLPPAWSGPTAASGPYWIIAIGGVALGVVAALLYLALVTRVAHDCVREARLAREELTLHAIARARDLEQLGAQLSHELKNPLSAIKTLVQLSVPMATDPELRERLEVVEGEVQRMQQTLQDYLSFSRPLETLRREDVALERVVDDVLALLAGRGAAVGVALHRRGEARVTADPLRLKEALLNLIVNALEASSHGGRIEVDIGEERDQIRVAIRDFGRGMTEDVLSRIGAPFFTTREEGTGLGVALARATFIGHGGTLTYTSRPGAGTTATVTLPTPADRRSDGARAGGG